MIHFKKSKTKSNYIIRMAGFFIFILFGCIQTLTAASFTNTSGNKFHCTAAPIKVTKVSFWHFVDQYGINKEVRLSFAYTNSTMKEVHGILMRCRIRDPFNEELLNTQLKAQEVIPATNKTDSGVYWRWNTYSDTYQKLWGIAANKTAKIDVEILQIVYAGGKMWFSDSYLSTAIDNIKTDEDLTAILEFTGKNKYYDEKLLITALQRCSIPALQKLIKRKVDLNKKFRISYYEYTPVFYLLTRSYGSEPVIELLLKNGADPNIKCYYYRSIMTPLHLAVLKKNLNAARLLLKYGATIHAKDSNNKTPLHYAVKHKNNKMIRLLRNWKKP